MKNRGFTLIEIMIVVAILGVIFAIAMPSYNNYVSKARRADAMTLLIQIMNAQERYYIEERSYTVDLTETGFASKKDLATESDWYLVSASKCDTETPITACVMLTAVPQNSQASDGNLTINSLGQKTGNW